MEIMGIFGSRLEAQEDMPEIGGKMSNKSNGTTFEKEFAQKLSEYGFWVHRLQDNHNGQPFDVIAARDGETLVFDCKDCQSSNFYLRRIEDNQRNAMKLWNDCGNAEGIFAVRYPDGEIFLMLLNDLEEAEINGIRQIDQDHAKYYGALFSAWLERIGQYEGNYQ